MYYMDDWPTMPDGNDYDGKHVLQLLREGRSPFTDCWDVGLLVKEIEEQLDTRILDIPSITKGSNHYGFHIRLSDRPDVVARLARDDVNMPDFDGFNVKRQVSEVMFEAAVYTLLQVERAIRASPLFYYRAPVEHPHPHLNVPNDISGRRLFVFERAEGVTLDWNTPNPEQKNHVLAQAATIRAALFNYTPPLQFVSDWFLERLFEHKPASLPVPVTPTRDFCLAVFTSKLEATIRNIGDMIGWESDNVTVGPIAAAGKESLLRLVPHILPDEDGSEPNLYRLVLDHGDFGVHNMSITEENFEITSLFDWETGCIVPALLSDPLMAVAVDIVTDENGDPEITRVEEKATPKDRERYMHWATHFINVLYDQAPLYRPAIQAGNDARHLWFALRDWRGEDPEGYFGALGNWAEQRLRDLGVTE